MSLFYPTAGQHLVMMDSLAWEAERRAINDSLLEQAALARRRSRVPRRRMLLYRLSLRMVAWGARLVQYGLPPYEPSRTLVSLASN